FLPVLSAEKGGFQVTDLRRPRVGTYCPSDFEGLVSGIPVAGEELGVLVANPGSIPEVPVIAAALASAGLLRLYLAPFGSNQPRLNQRMARGLPRGLVVS